MSYAPRASRTPRAPRAPRPIDVGWVEQAAAEHLARYACTRAHLKTLLKGRIRRAVHKGAVVAGGIEAALDTVLDRHVALGTLNDAAWAETKARTLTRRGVASGLVRQRLRQQGITDTAAAMDTVAEELRGTPIPGEEAESVPTDLVAACAWARRKRAGAFAREGGEAADPTDRAAVRAEREAARAAENKVLSAMARAGFSFDVSRRVLKMDRDEAEELLLKLR